MSRIYLQEGASDSSTGYVAAVVVGDELDLVFVVLVIP